MTIQIAKPEVEVLLKGRLQSGEFKGAEDLILQALRALEPTQECVAAERAAAVERLKTFGKRHGLSLGGMTIRELRDEARP